MSVELVQANALALPLADASIDLVVTSPPYFGLRSYEDDGRPLAGQIGAEPTPAQYVDALVAATREMVRVTRPTGSIWVNIGDKYGRPGGGADVSARSLRGAGQSTTRRVYTRAADGIRAKSLTGAPWRYALRCMDDLGLTLRAEVIWEKPNGIPESVRDRVKRTHEQWFHFTLCPTYYSSPDRDSSGSVWQVPIQPLHVPEDVGIGHYAAFPMEFPRRIIEGWCPPGGVVLDPFGGTGTTAMVASALGRRGISVDLSGDYQRLARWRSSDPGEQAAALGVRRPPPAPVAVDSLLDLL